MSKQTLGPWEMQKHRAVTFYHTRGLEQHQSPRAVPIDSPRLLAGGTGQQHQHSQTQSAPTSQSAAAPSPAEPGCGVMPPWEPAHTSPGSQQHFQDAVCPSSLLGWGRRWNLLFPLLLLCTLGVRSRLLSLSATKGRRLNKVSAKGHDQVSVGPPLMVATPAEPPSPRSQPRPANASPPGFNAGGHLAVPQLTTQRSHPAACRNAPALPGSTTARFLRAAGRGKAASGL